MKNIFVSAWVLFVGSSAVFAGEPETDKESKDEVVSRSCSGIVQAQEEIVNKDEVVVKLLCEGEVLIRVQAAGFSDRLTSSRHTDSEAVREPHSKEDH